MRIHKIIVKTTLSVLIALGAVAEAANAAQAVHNDYANMNPQQAKRAASTLRHMTDNFAGGPILALTPHLIHADATGTRELLKAKTTNNLDAYVGVAKTAIKTATDHYIDTVLLAANGPFIIAAVANGGPNQPANLTRDAFKIALRAAIDAPNTAALTALDAKVAVPASLRLSVLAATEEGVKNAIALAVDAWIDTLLGANAAFLDVAVARQDNGGGGDTPADVNRDSFKAVLTYTIDNVNI